MPGRHSAGQRHFLQKLGDILALHEVYLLENVRVLLKNNRCHLQFTSSISLPWLWGKNLRTWWFINLRRLWGFEGIVCPRFTKTQMPNWEEMLSRASEGTWLGKWSDSDTAVRAAASSCWGGVLHRTHEQKIPQICFTETVLGFSKGTELLEWIYIHIST